MQADSLPSEPPGKPGHTSWCMVINKMYPHLCKELITTERLTQHPYLIPGGTGVKNLPANAGRCKRRGFSPWAGKIPWRRAWQPVPLFLLGESHGQRSLVGCSSLGHKELDITEVTQHTCMHAPLSYIQPDFCLTM